jgi:hypothetical protein
VPKFTIDLTDAALNGLQRVVAGYNANQGSQLTAQKWIVLHLRELAIAADLSAATVTLKQQAEQQAREAFAAAVIAERQRLLSAIDG